MIWAAQLATFLFEWFESSLGEESSVTITTNEDGNYSYGPVYKGTYQYRLDVDSDGFYELME